MEIWDAYDVDCRKIEGMTLIRGEEKSIPQGVYHLVTPVLVKHTDGTYLLTRRDIRKSCGGMWEASAGGSALMGETAYESAARELREETGIVSGEFYELDRTVSDKDRCIYFFYLCITGCDKDSIVLQEGETCEYKWAQRQEVLDMESEIVSFRALRYIKEKGSDSV